MLCNEQLFPRKVVIQFPQLNTCVTSIFTHSLSQNKTDSKEGSCTVTTLLKDHRQAGKGTRNAERFCSRLLEVLAKLFQLIADLCL